MFVEKVIEVKHYSDRLFSFKTTRDRAFRFKNGEFAMIGLDADPRPIYRAYSIVSTCYDEHLEFLSIKVPDGPLTSKLQNIQVGSEILIKPKCTGSLVIDYLKPTKNLVMLSTGTGIAPFMSICRDFETYEKYDNYLNKLEDDRRITSYENDCKSNINYTLKITRSSLSDMKKRDRLSSFLKMEEKQTENFTVLDENGKKTTKSYTVTKDEGPRKGTNKEALAKLRPVFAAGGSVTAGNSSQMSDGAAFVMVMSEDMVKELNLEPVARLVSYAAAGVEPRIMGIGPVAAIPKALKQAGMKQNNIELIELNEAFASQSLAVIRALDLDREIINVNGGAIALGHPLGCTGAKLSVQLFDEMRKREMKNKYGMVTMCVGTGQGAAGIFEFLN